MAFAISPKHRLEEFPDGLTLDDKIQVFIARVRGWQIQPALDMAKRKIPHRGFAQLLIVVSYFEMVGKYRSGYVGEGQSKRYFKEGLIFTFSDIPIGEEELLDEFYRGIRNGLYHVGMTRPNVILHDGIPGSFAFNESLGALVISPDRFVEDISIRFEAFAAELSDPSNAELRANFEKRFDSENTYWRE